jgi:hypothetical protein
LQSFFREHPRVAALVVVVMIAGVWTMDARRAWAEYGRWSSGDWIATVVGAALAGVLALPLLSAVMRPSLRYDDMASGSLGPIAVTAGALWSVPFVATHDRSGSSAPLDDRWELAAAVFSDVLLVPCAIAVVWLSRRYLASRASRVD